MWPLNRNKSLKELLEQETTLMDELARIKEAQENMQREYEYKNKEFNIQSKHLKEELKKTRLKLRTYFTDAELEQLLGKDE